jgi:uncharacterized membrane protein YfcA
MDLFSAYPFAAHQWVFAVAGGALAGRWLLKLVPQLWFERILLASAALAAVRLIWH